MRAHIGSADAGHFNGLFHRIATEGLAKFLIDHRFDERRLAMFHLVFDSFRKRIAQFVLRAGFYTLQAAGFGNVGIRDFRV